MFINLFSLFPLLVPNSATINNSLVSFENDGTPLITLVFVSNNLKYWLCWHNFVNYASLITHRGCSTCPLQLCYDACMFSVSH